MTENLDEIVERGFEIETKIDLKETKDNKFATIMKYISFSMGICEGTIWYRKYSVREDIPPIDIVNGILFCSLLTLPFLIGSEYSLTNKINMKQSKNTLIIGGVSLLTYYSLHTFW